MPPEDVVNVLGRMLEAVAPGGLVLDLQVIRPNPRVKVEGRVICEIDGEPLFEWADAAIAAVDDRIAAGELVEEAVDDHDVLTHYPSGRDVVEDFAESRRRLPESALPHLQATAAPCVVEERCRLRRLRAPVRGMAGAGVAAIEALMPAPIDAPIMNRTCARG